MTKDYPHLNLALSLHAPTQLAQEVFRTARPLLAKEADGRVRYRLIGVGLSGLSPYHSDGVDLIDPKVAKRAAAERASDKARAKFGSGAVMTGRAARMAKKDEG